MQHSKSKVKRKTKLIILLALFALIVVSLFLAKPDNRFILSNMFNQLAQSAKIKVVEIDSNTLIPISGLQDKDAEIKFNNALILVNKDNPIDDKTEINLIDYKNTGVLMDKTMEEMYSQLSDAVKVATGDNLYVLSHYRTDDEQLALYKEDSKTATLPGTSEHQIGLALDVYVKYFAGMGFLKSPAGQFVNRNCWEYGFIIRYPIFKKHITGIKFEPWHIRYVGMPHSEIIYKKGITLEEYIDSLDIGEYYEYDGYYISRQKKDEVLIPNSLDAVEISPDNMGNFIVTGRTRQ